MSPAKGARILFDGQSLNYAPAVQARDYPNQVMAGLPGRIWNNIGFSGKSWTVLTSGDSAVLPLANRYARNSMYGQPMIAVLNGGQSDILAPENQTGAQAYADLISYCNAIRAAGVDRIIVCTMGPIAASWQAGAQTQVDAYNVLVRAGNAAYEQVVDLAGIPALQNSADVAIYSDGLHYTDAGATIAANAVRPAIVAAEAALT